MKNRFQGNILLIGKTGSGKSSFANYLLGVDAFKQGSGFPVTSWEDNFQSQCVKIKGFDINVYDSVGLEANNYQEWNKKLLSFLKEKKAKSVQEQIHIVFYVVNCASARVENNEIEILNEIKNSFDVCTVTILTNCDIASQEQIGKIEDIFKSKKIEYIKTISISKPTRKNPNPPKTQGKEEAEFLLLDATYESVGKVFIKNLLNEMASLVVNKNESIKKQIDKSELSALNLIFDNDLSTKKQLDKIIREMNLDLDFNIFGEAKQKFQDYIEFLAYFRIKFDKKDKLKDVLNQLYSVLPIEEHKQIEKDRRVLSYRLDSDNIIIDAIEDFSTIKTILNKIIDEKCQFFIRKIETTKSVLNIT